VTMALVDTACGYAALTLMPPDQEVLTVELKVNLLAPGRGRRVEAIGTVLRPGRTLTVCRGDVHTVDQAGHRTYIAPFSRRWPLDAGEAPRASGSIGAGGGQRGSGRFSTTLFMTRVELIRWTPGSVARHSS